MATLLHWWLRWWCGGFDDEQLQIDDDNCWWCLIDEDTTSWWMNDDLELLMNVDNLKKKKWKVLLWKKDSNRRENGCDMWKWWVVRVAWVGYNCHNNNKIK